MDLGAQHALIAVALTAGSVLPFTSVGKRTPEWIKVAALLLVCFYLVGEVEKSLMLELLWRCAVLVVLGCLAYGLILLHGYRKKLKSLDQYLTQKNDELMRLALQDHLTKLANRRHFDYQIGVEISRAQRVGQPFALLMIDVDHFKSYNDHGGHLRGDACLVQIADALRKSVRRPEDLVARYGGEEFVILMPGAHLEDAIEIAENMRLAIQEMALPYTDPRRAGPVTVSVGVTVAHPVHHTVTAADVIEAADTGLYQAKHSGRNCIRAIPCCFRSEGGVHLVRRPRVPSAVRANSPSTSPDILGRTLKSR